MPYINTEHLLAIENDLAYSNCSIVKQPDCLFGGKMNFTFDDRVKTTSTVILSKVFLPPASPRQGVPNGMSGL